MANIPSPTPNLTQSLAPHELEGHRAKIGVLVEVILDGYWQTRPSDQIKTMILIEWMDELQDWHVDQIQAAMRKWRRENPNKKPNPGHVLSELKALRGKVWAGHINEPGVRALFSVERPLAQIERGAA